jgi:hypothetical protein
VETTSMNACKTHQNHAHTHGAGCGHKRVKHNGHEDYLHDGHMHHVHGDHIDEHELSVSPGNPGMCTPTHACGAHAADHKHGPGCGHEAVPHEGHIDYVVGGHLHHHHDSHCDDHGAVTISS